MFKLFKWVSLLPEVGPPIRDAAREIDIIRESARRKFDEEMRGAEELEAQLMEDIKSDWTQAEILEAKTQAGIRRSAPKGRFGLGL